MKNGRVINSTVVADVDSIIFRPASSVTDEGIVINGIKWATRNVGAPGTFVANPTDPGMLYQWNSTTGWSSTDPLVSTNGSVWHYSWNGNGATTWETKNNVCPQGWRMPTKAEFDNLLTVTSKSWTTIPAAGYIFSVYGKTLFLPAAGFRDGAAGGMLSLAGEEGHYWSSTVGDITSPNYSYFLRFSSDGANTFDFNRNKGASCRCVAE